VIVEKILGPSEVLPPEWPVQGTTGYDFMDQVNALQHDPSGELALDELWGDMCGSAASFDEVETAARQEVLRGAFAGQLAACAALFADLAHAGLSTRDLTSESFRRILVSLIAHLRRYRTYATGRADGARPDGIFLEAIRLAKESLPADAAAAEFVVAVLSGGGGNDPSGQEEVVRRLNQLCAPVAAKAVEDTAFYRYGRLLSRNDVGFQAGRMAMPAVEFIASGQDRVRNWPKAMLTTATHDHKRGEDVRARLAVLSEISEEWRVAVQSWLVITAPQRPGVIALDDAYMLFQTLVGAWPFGLASDDAVGLREFGERVALWRIKALREAKVHTSWAAPDTDYEEANVEWLRRLLDPGQSLPFLRSVGAFVARIAPAGAINSVVQAALRCAWPGIPDIYQGAELWDLSLVDPDNRRPVDFTVRQTLLRDHAADFPSGAIKQSVIARLLRWRRDDPALFTIGELHPVDTRGARASHVLAFRRHVDGRSALFAVVLRIAEPCRVLGSLPSADWWGDTEVFLASGWQKAATLFLGSPVYAEPVPAAASPTRAAEQAA
jgi:(1->4)-alpha-D-glucan 1-alpha-D-glucosylmutase